LVRVLRAAIIIITDANAEKRVVRDKVVSLRVVRQEQMRN
jgi:hypothetical protein